MHIFLIWNISLIKKSAKKLSLFIIEKQKTDRQTSKACPCKKSYADLTIAFGERGNFLRFAPDEV